ncbi:MAG: hypothetical protein OHK0021_24040 [Bryobacter sp.]
MHGAHISRVIFEYASRTGGARDLVGADRCSIWLIDRKASQLWTMVAHGVDELRIPLGHGLVGAAVEAGETIVSNDAGNDPRLLARASGGYETKSVLVISLRAGDGTVIGALQALNKPGGFSPEDVNLLGLAAS